MMLLLIFLSLMFGNIQILRQMGRCVLPEVSFLCPMLSCSLYHRKLLLSYHFKTIHPVAMQKSWGWDILHILHSWMLDIVGCVNYEGAEGVPNNSTFFKCLWEPGVRSRWTPFSTILLRYKIIHQQRAINKSGLNQTILQRRSQQVTSFVVTLFCFYCDCLLVIH